MRTDAIQRLDAAVDKNLARGVADDKVAIEVAETVGATNDVSLCFKHAPIGNEVCQRVAVGAAAVKRHLHHQFALHGRSGLASVWRVVLRLALSFAHLEHLRKATL